MRKNVYVLGLCYSHDASACLVKNGIPIAAIQKERITRKKHDGSISSIDLPECIEYCLKAAEIELKDLDLIVENSPTILYCKERKNVLTMNTRRYLDDFDQDKIITISHHLAHAYCAFGLNPAEQCAVLVIDGQGNYMEDVTEDLSGAVIFPVHPESSYIERESFYEIGPGGFRVLRKNFGTVHKSFVRVAGLGHLYETVASYAFKTRHDAGKLMGLAPYGKEVFDFKMLEVLPSTEIKYHNEWIRNFSHPNRSEGDLEKHFEEYSNLAFKMQASLEEGVISLSRWLGDNSSMKSLSYSGGVALNCVTNRKIMDSCSFEDLYITPPASDCGVSMGCALYGYLQVLKQPKVKFDYTDYLGKSYDTVSIERDLSPYRKLVHIEEEADICARAASLMTSGNIIGWFQNGSEFGPRTLGNRTIMCDPRNPSMKEILNAKVKAREAFRPFAPSALEEYAREFFDVDRSPYMLLTADVHPEMREKVPTITHVDGSARLQTVRQEHNPLFHRVIEKFFALTAVPVVLNTSFNRQEPIVETPEDAIRCFLNTQIDYLCIQNFLVSKKS